MLPPAPAPASLPAPSLRLAIVSLYALITATLLSLHILVLTALPEPPALAPRRGLTRRWRRQRFRERCRTSKLRIQEMLHT